MFRTSSLYVCVLVLAGVPPATRAFEYSSKIETAAEAKAGLQAQVSAADMGLQQGGHQELSIWAKEAKSVLQSHSSLITKRARRGWQRRADSILSMISGLEHKEAPDTVIVLIKSVLDILETEMTSTETSCDSTKNLFNETKITLFKAVAEVPPLISSSQTHYDAYSTCLGGVVDCWGVYHESDCSESEDPSPTTPPPEVVHDCNAESKHNFVVPQGDYQFMCDFETETADSCFDRMTSSLRDPSLPQDLNNEYKSYHSEASCRRDKAVSEAEKLAATAALEHQKSCDDQAQKCTWDHDACHVSRQTLYMTMCNSLQTEVLEKCKLSDDFLKTSGDRSLQSFKDGEAKRKEDWEGLYLIHCMLTKFTAQKTFEARFRETCASEMEGKYKEDACSFGDLIDGVTEDTEQPKIDVPATCPSATDTDLLTFDRYPLDWTTGGGHEGRVGWRLGDAGQSCDDACTGKGLTCRKENADLADAKFSSVLRSLGVTCQDSTDARVGAKEYFEIAKGKSCDAEAEDTVELGEHTKVSLDACKTVCDGTEGCEYVSFKRAGPSNSELCSLYKTCGTLTETPGGFTQTPEQRAQWVTYTNREENHQQNSPISSTQPSVNSVGQCTPLVPGSDFECTAKKTDERRLCWCEAPKSTLHVRSNSVGTLKVTRDGVSGEADVCTHLEDVIEAVSACDSSQAPAHGHVGTCPLRLKSGSSCQPTCSSGYRVSGPTACLEKRLTAATCVKNPAPAPAPIYVPWPAPPPRR